MFTERVATPQQPRTSMEESNRSAQAHSTVNGVCVSPPVSKGTVCQQMFAAGGQSSLMLLCPTKLCIREGSIHWPWMCTCVNCCTSCPIDLVCFHGSSCFLPPNFRFSAAELSRSFTTAELCSHAQTTCSTFQVNRLFRHAVPSPFSTWQLS